MAFSKTNGITKCESNILSLYRCSSWNLITPGYSQVTVHANCGNVKVISRFKEHSITVENLYGDMAPSVMLLWMVAAHGFVSTRQIHHLMA